MSSLSYVLFMNLSVRQRSVNVAAIWLTCFGQSHGVGTDRDEVMEWGQIETETKWYPIGRINPQNTLAREFVLNSEFPSIGVLFVLQKSFVSCMSLFAQPALILLLNRVDPRTCA